jgi:hypothetical protein
MNEPTPVMNERLSHPLDETENNVNIWRIFKPQCQQQVYIRVQLL